MNALNVMFWFIKMKIIGFKGNIKHSSKDELGNQNFVLTIKYLK